MKSVEPYLNFDGNTREAMNFYASCLGGDLQVQTFRDAGLPPNPATDDRVVHARLTRGPIVIMASDTMPGMPYAVGNNCWLTVICESAEELERLFTALGQGGKVAMEPQDTFWGARFGMLTDRYGTGWMFNYELPKS